jgi:hypothetical protein
VCFGIKALEAALACDTGKRQKERDHRALDRVPSNFLRFSFS